MWKLVFTVLLYLSTNACTPANQTNEQYRSNATFYEYEIIFKDDSSLQSVYNIDEVYDLMASSLNELNQSREFKKRYITTFYSQTHSSRIKLSLLEPKLSDLELELVAKVFSSKFSQVNVQSVKYSKVSLRTRP